MPIRADWFALCKPATSAHSKLRLKTSSPEHTTETQTSDLVESRSESGCLARLTNKFDDANAFVASNFDRAPDVPDSNKLTRRLSTSYIWNQRNATRVGKLKTHREDYTCTCQICRCGRLHMHMQGNSSSLPHLQIWRAGQCTCVTNAVAYSQRLDSTIQSKNRQVHCATLLATSYRARVTHGTSCMK